MVLFIVVMNIIKQHSQNLKYFYLHPHRLRYCHYKCDGCNCTRIIYLYIILILAIHKPNLFFFIAENIQIQLNSIVMKIQDIENKLLKDCKNGKSVT